MNTGEGAYDERLGIWIRVAGASESVARAALFLDRDGVIVEETNYLCKAEEVVLIEGAAELIAAANGQGTPVVVVTNQAGIGRGYYGWEGFVEVEEEIARQLERFGARVDAVLACPFHHEGVEPWRHPEHPARKPRPGMLVAAAERLNLDLARSWIVGDHLSDMGAGRNAGLRGGMHVLTGHGAWERKKVEAETAIAGFEVLLGDSIREAGAVLATLRARSRGCGAIAEAMVEFSHEPEPQK